MVFFKRSKAASTTEMGLLVGLIAVGIILAVQGTGKEIAALLNTSANAVAGNAPDRAGSGNGDNQDNGLYAFSSHTFSNCGVTGRQGPTLANCTAVYSPDWTDNTAFFNITTQGIQLWTVPKTGTYRITATGAGGGDSDEKSSTIGGYGVEIAGDFTLTEGDQLKILVGQRGGDAVNRSGCNNTSSRAAGGGGGSFVTTDANSALLVAAGGNGDSWQAWNTSGPSGRATSVAPAGASNQGRGGSGGGLTTNGVSNNSSASSGGGGSFVSGGVGGQRSNACNTGEGGFGGGGGALYEGGGAGGYVGGNVVATNQYNTNFPTYGASSFNGGANQSVLSISNTSHGSVQITLQN